MLLIKQANVYAPEYLGTKDVLIGGSQIEEIADCIEVNTSSCRVIDGTGKKLTPGILDPHVHVTGGGGEGSFRTQVPAVKLSELIGGGVTTVVGLLGTDGMTRSVENLIARVKALKEEGISAYAYTGSYGYPSITVTGDVRKDIVFIEEVIGVKLAISDHRAPNLPIDNLITLASDARTAGMVSGKCGIVVLHMGDDPYGLAPVFIALRRTAIPAKVYRPTHVNRNAKLLSEAFQYAKMGGYIDLTCGMAGESRPAKCVMEAKSQGVPMDHITISSDGMGSWSTYDEAGNLQKIGYSRVDTNYLELQHMVLECGLPMEEALTFITSNTARSLNLYPKKGCIKPGADADLLLMDSDLKLETVIAMGAVMMEDGKVIRKGTFEE